MQENIAPYLRLLEKHLHAQAAADEISIASEQIRRVAAQIRLAQVGGEQRQRRDIEFIHSILGELQICLRCLDNGQAFIAALSRHCGTPPDHAGAMTSLQGIVASLSREGGEEVNALLLKIASYFAEQEQLLDREVRDTLQSESRAGQPVPFFNRAQLDALQCYLREVDGAGSGLELVSLEPLLGGGSKLTAMISLHNAVTLPDALVLRLDKQVGVVDSSVVNEYQLIASLHAAAMPVPEPYAMCCDRTVLGAPFILLSKLAGSNVGDPIEVYLPSLSLGEDLARAMARLHGLDCEAIADLIPHSSASIREQLAANIDKFEGNWRAGGYRSVALEMAYAWLKSHLDFADGSRALLHCDIGPHNMVVDQGRLVGLLDWETVLIGNPAHDLAYAHNMVKQLMPWEAFLAEYRKGGGTLPSQREFDFYFLWCAVWRMHYVFLARSFFAAGLGDDLVLAYAGQHIFQRVHCELHARLTAVLERYGV